MPDDATVETFENSWHSEAGEAALERLETSADGLASDEAAKRLERDGPNRLAEPPRKSALKRFLRQFHNILIYVLLAAAFITAALGHLIDSGVILAVVFINAIIGFLQEGKAEKAMEAIRKMLAPHANVLRDGNRENVEGEVIVPGDIVLLEAGDKVPADMRLLSAHGLQIQEAILTGESVPVDKDTEPAEQNAALGDRSCMAFSGTFVTSGQGKAVVVATGGDTEIGRISGMISSVETLTTPLVKQMDRFAKWLTGFILLMATAIFLFGYFVQDYAFAELFMIVVGLAVAAIPEGLPAVLTITLAIGVQAMAKRNAIVRRLPAIETLGSVSVICTDKTGTLTRNEMMVASALTSEHCFALAGQGYEPEGALTLGEKQVEPTEYTVLEDIARAATLCNDAQIHQEDDVWEVEGDPMEGALLAFAGKMGLQPEQERKSWSRTDAIPFDSKHRFMATLHHDHQGNACIYIKGAPERILEMCSRQQTVEDETQLEAAYWQEHADQIAAKGQRVLALAMQPVDDNKTVLEFSDVESGLTLLGLVGMIDPPRDEAVKAVKECYHAGIDVKMITGDHAGTAAAIGKQIGLQKTGHVLTGAKIDALDDEALKQAVMETDIFARTSPEHKLRLVKALQADGLTVAMTGDGVNDAPALKRADAGIAMGQKGSEAAKESAEFVLADDNFASIAAAVKEGRTVYDNLKKVISWTLPTNGAEAMTILLALTLGMTLPITPVQILWINLITAVTLGIALAFEPSESGTMKRPPRSPDEPLLTGQLIWLIILISLLFAGFVFAIYQYAIEQGASIDYARTMAVNMLVVLEMMNLFYIRNLYSTSLSWQMIKGTRVMWAVIAAVITAQLIFTYVPAAQLVFLTENISLFDGLIIILSGFICFAILEIEKQIRLKYLGDMKKRR